MATITKLRKFNLDISQVEFKIFLYERIYGATYSRIDQVKLFKGCLPQILVGPFLNTLPYGTLLSLILANFIII